MMNSGEEIVLLFQEALTVLVSQFDMDQSELLQMKGTFLL